MGNVYFSNLLLYLTILLYNSHIFMLKLEKSKPSEKCFLSHQSTVGARVSGVSLS